MLKLKQYQIRALDFLRRFMKRCGNLEGVKPAFHATTEEAVGFPCEYHQIEGELKEVPYVCLRVPTGGGKTLMACHSIGIASEEYKHSDNSLVLWLVPTTPILDQTVSALKDVSHPYRQALEAQLGNVVVKTVSEALYLSPGDVDNCTCVIVATMQSFKRDDTLGLRVYRQDGALMSFFDSGALTNLTENNPDTGKPVESLANVIAMRRPIVIIDEAHNARTPLTFDTLANFKPSCIIEFTATPDVKCNPSNILYSVSAQEFKSEEMIKLPIVVEGRPDWHELLQDAINRRNQLERLAKLEQQKTGEYIRPIMLIQSEKKSEHVETIHAERLKEILITDFRLSPDEVKIATGPFDEISKLDLFKDDCDVRYIITQQKLKEGWDCSFAYVLCSIVESHSKIQVEQILGRILRMPKAKRKYFPELNQSYAFATASFTEIAQNLKDALTQNGFDRQDVERLIQQAPAYYGGCDDLFPDFRYPTGGLPDSEVVLMLTDRSEIPYLATDGVFESKVEFNPHDGVLIFHEPMTPKDREILIKHCPKDTSNIERAFLQSNHIHVANPSPAERRLNFAVPLLSLQQGELFESFEDILDECDWSLSQVPAMLSGSEYTPSTGEVQRGTIDAENGKIVWEFSERVQQETAYWDINAVHNWEVSDLVYWLDKRIEHRDVTAMEMTAFLSKLILDLQTLRNIPLAQMVEDKYKLKTVVESKINAARQQARKQAFQQLLMPDSKFKAVVTPERCFQYPADYPVSNQYNGSYKFKKHYYPIVGGFDGKDGGEEEQCAIFIDQMPEVEYWVRNLDQREHDSFFLQLHNRKFYPDFVVKLKNGRILVVEYKGADRYSNDDSKEKRIIGDFWARNSNGHCLFVMTNGKNYNAIDSTIQQRL